MNFDALIDLARIEHGLRRRIAVYHDIVDERGKVIDSIFRGYAMPGVSDGPDHATASNDHDPHTD